MENIYLVTGITTSILLSFDWMMSSLYLLFRVFIFAFAAEDSRSCRFCSFWFFRRSTFNWFLALWKWFTCRTYRSSCGLVLLNENTLFSSFTAALALDAKVVVFFRDFLARLIGNRPSRPIANGFFAALVFLLDKTLSLARLEATFIVLPPLLYLLLSVVYT